MKTTSDQLRLSDTNSASDSEGKTWGLEGNLFWYLIGGIFVAVITLLLLFSVFECSFTQSLVIAAVPLLVAVGYVFGLRHGKPPGYDVDLLESSLCGKGFAPVAGSTTQHPLHHVAD